MYEKDGVFYAGEPNNPIGLPRVVGVKALDAYRLLLCFSTGEKKIYDCTSLLEYPAFQPLKNKEVFSGVYVQYGAPVWNNGEIDIDPECVYENGMPVE
jgi:hypothetical protein